MKKRHGRKVNIDADLDEDFENYEPSDSDDGLDENDKNLLENAVGRKKLKGEEEVLKVYSSEDSEDEGEDEEEESNDEEKEEKLLYGGGVGSDMDSDIEGKEEDDGLPDSKAWGSDKKQYYDTDYVDKDFLDFDDEEAAFEEEKEADVIQRRLMSHLEGTDFTLGLLDTIEEKKKQAAKKREEPEVVEDEEEVVEVDLSKLSPEELLELVKRKSPELFPIIEHCKVRVLYLKDKVLPVLELLDSGVIKRSKVIDFLEIMHSLILNYTVVVLFYLHLKEMGKRTTDHPVINRLKGLNLLLKEMDGLRKKVDPQIDILLEKVENGEDIGEEEVKEPEEPPPKNRKERRKRKLELLKKKEQEDAIIEKKKQKLLRLQEVNFEEQLENRAKKQQNAAEELIYSEEEEDENEEDVEKEQEKNAGDKRAVTFEILKNKGLTPRRKKENRNPRVKHRNKFKKALVRRKGQVREPRKEINKYGGEISGIKSHVRKSIKLN